jgi:hypothetical protein
MRGVSGASIPLAPAGSGAAIEIAGTECRHITGTGGFAAAMEPPPVTGEGTRVEATLWHQAGRRPVMIWPLWSNPLDVSGIQALIEHPCLAPIDPRPAVRSDPRPAVRSDEWPTLGIFAVYGAERQCISGRNFAGVLPPCPVTVEAA